MKKLLALTSLILFVFGAVAQETTLTFTAQRHDNSYQRLDSIHITNLSKNWTEVIYYPDTLLIMSSTGIVSWGDSHNKVRLFQNVPNPFNGITEFNLVLTEPERVALAIYDLNGKVVAEFRKTLPAGEHQFRAAMASPQAYLLSAMTQDGNASIKMINAGNTGEQCHIDYISSLPLSEEMTRKHTDFEFVGGDEMQYIGYTTQTDGPKEATITQFQNSSETITFTFPDESGTAVLPTVQTLSVDRANGGTAEVLSKILSDGGATILEAGILCSTDSIPNNSNSQLFTCHNIAGDGTFTTAAIRLTQEVKYTKFYVRAYARNAMGTAYGQVLSFIVNKDFHCGDKVYDIEGNAYPTVKIGSQCWTAENMRSKTYADGTKLQPLTTSAEYVYGRYYYERTDDVVGTEVYYPWSSACNWVKAQANQDAIMQGICPDGWHVPTYKEYATMLKAVDPSFNAGSYVWNDKQYTLPSSNKLAVKLACPTARWTWFQGPGYTGDTTISTVENTPGYNYHNHINDPDANSSGFNVKPTGYWKNGNFYFNGAANLWTSIGSPTQVGRTVVIRHNETGIVHLSYASTAKEGYSVRCVYGTGDPVIPVYPTLEDNNSFSMIFLSDPQSYSKFGLNQPLFELQTAWTALVRNRLNVKAALISGDFVEQNDKDDPYVNGRIDASAQNQMDQRNGDQTSQQQWESVSRALERLDNVLPYVPCQGNHDCGPLAAEDRRSEMPKYIYPERNMMNENHLVDMCTNYQGKKTMENSAFEFHTDTWGDLLVIGFEFAPRDEVLNWTKQLIESDKYKNHRVIIFTHSFLNEEGEQYTTEGYTLQPRNWAKDVWNKLIYNSKNIVMVLCGHAGSPTTMKSTVDATDYSCTVSFRTDTAADGREIPQMMFNAQCADGSWYGNGGDGWIRILEFKPDGQTIGVKTFSPLFALSQLTKTQAWRTKDYDQFTITVPKLSNE